MLGATQWNVVFVWPGPKLDKISVSQLVILYGIQIWRDEISALHLAYVEISWKAIIYCTIKIPLKLCFLLLFNAIYTQSQFLTQHWHSYIKQWRMCSDEWLFLLKHHNMGCLNQIISTLKIFLLLHHTNVFYSVGTTPWQMRWIVHWTALSICSKKNVQIFLTNVLFPSHFLHCLAYRDVSYRGQTFYWTLHYWTNVERQKVSFPFKDVQ